MSVKSFFRFPGFPGRKRKEARGRTFVLREAGEGRTYANLPPPKKGTKGREEEARKEGEEAREGEVVFYVREDGRSWKHKNMIVCLDGSSGYVVYIMAGEGKEEDMIVCKVPHLWSLLDLLSPLNEGKNPLFSSMAEHKPTGTI